MMLYYGWDSQMPPNIFAIWLVIWGKYEIVNAAFITVYLLFSFLNRFLPQMNRV